MSKATYPLKLPAILGLDPRIATAAAQKIGVVETAAEFLLARRGRRS
jgi:hypothetical protein